jgi:nucleotide-binding universal stress UspA family protein
MTGALHGIVVGYDGSAGSEQAVAWAAREARDRGEALIVCHAWAPGDPGPPGEAAALKLARRNGERILASGLKLARGLMGSGEVRPSLTAGTPAGALCEHSADAAMVVVGSRGHGGLAGLLLGSVSLKVAEYASGRVVVVRGHLRVPGHIPGPIVIGTEGSAASEPAVEFAFEEAALRSTFLLAVCALADTPGMLGGKGRIRKDFEYLIAGWEQKHPEVAVRCRVTDGTARAALLEAAHEAQMLVVGARGSGGIAGMMLGSVSHALLQHAPCPVGVAHSSSTRERETRHPLPTHFTADSAALGWGAQGNEARDD